eukprot:13981143-Alexandrium_andersonii.AAC.1
MPTCGCAVRGPGHQGMQPVYGPRAPCALAVFFNICQGVHLRRGADYCRQAAQPLAVLAAPRFWHPVTRTCLER